MTYLSRIHENWPKLAENWEFPPPPPGDRILHRKGREVFKMTTNLCEKCVIYGSLMKNHKKWTKSDLKLTKDSWTKELSRENNLFEW